MSTSSIHSSRPAPTYLLKCPDEIILSIFTLLPGKDIVNARCACKRLYEVLKDNTLWMKILKRDLPKTLCPSPDLALSIYRTNVLTERNWQKGQYRFVDITSEIQYEKSIAIVSNEILVMGAQNSGMDLEKFALSNGDKKYSLNFGADEWWDTFQIYQNFIICYSTMGIGPITSLIDFAEGKLLWEKIAYWQFIDGNRLIGWDESRRICIWDLLTGAEIIAIEDNTLEADSARIDESYLYYKTQHNVKVYDKYTGQLVKELLDFPESVDSTSRETFSWEKQLAITSKFDGSLLRNIEMSKNVQVQDNFLFIEESDGRIRICDFSSNSILPNQSSLEN